MDEDGEKGYGKEDEVRRGYVDEDEIRKPSRVDSNDLDGCLPRRCG